MKKYMFKFFTIICLLCMPFVAHAVGVVKLKVIDEGGVPIQNLHIVVQLQLEPGKYSDGYTYTTNHNGEISWRANYRRACENGHGLLGKVKYTVTDPINQEYKQKEVWSAKCSVTITMEKQSQPQPQQQTPRTNERRVYTDPANVAQNGPAQRDDITYYSMCTSTGRSAFATAATPRGARPLASSVGCDNFFADSKVQLNQAADLAKLYNSKYKKSQKKLHCKNTEFTIRNNQYYMPCVSEDKTEAYEFQFKDLRAALDDVQEYTADGICRIYGLEYLPFRHSFVVGALYNQTYGYLSGDMDTDRPGCALGDTSVGCGEIDWAAQQFSWAASKENDNCMFNFRDVDSNAELKTYNGLDSHAFENITVYSNEELFLLLYQYTSNKLGQKFKNLKCLSGARRQDNTYALDAFGWFGTDKEFVTCTLTTADNQNHEVQFLFKSVSATNDFRANGGRAGFRCIASDGTFDGRNCVAIGKAQCEAFNTQLPGGAKWNEQYGRCEMPDAVAVDQYDSRREQFIQLGKLVIGVVLTVATAGAGAGVLVLTVIDVGTSVYGQYLQDVQNVRARDFIAAAYACPSAEGASCDNAGCAKKVLLDAYGDIKNMVDPASNPDSNLSKAVTGAHDTCYENITENCIDATFVKQLQNTKGLVNQMAFVNTLNFVASMIRPGGGTKHLFIKSERALKVLNKVKNLWQGTNELWDIFDTGQTRIERASEDLANIY